MDYLAFINKHIPHSSLLKNSNASNANILYRRVTEANCCIEVFNNCVINKNIVADLYLNRFQRAINKLLLFVALNDSSSINFCMRTIAESFLKYLYAIYFQKSTDEINRISFRNIKEYILSYNSELYYNKVEVEKILCLYSYYSNLIHQKNENEEITFEYIEDLIVNGCMDVGFLDKKLVCYIDTYNLFTIKIFELDSVNLSLAQRVKLNNNLSVKRVKKLNNYFETNL